ncbi:hypothetical protein V1358_15535 [Pseudoalteromonas sp. YIC-656]|uniref:hypothetical protein n=1 Tax=Pseudoalteromonas pernae TaxID=3118054 RepID=UPI00324237A4
MNSQSEPELYRNYWATYFPDYADNKRFQEIYIRYALIGRVWLADGFVSSEELDWFDDLFYATYHTEEGSIAFDAGLSAGSSPARELSDETLLALCSQLTDRKRNEVTLKALFKAAFLDKHLDKSEYDFIQKVATAFKFRIPSFEVMEQKLNKDITRAKGAKVQKVTDVINVTSKSLATFGSALVYLLDTIVGSSESSSDSNPRMRTQRSSTKNRKGASITGTNTKSSKRPKRPSTKKLEANSIIGRSRKVCCTCEYWTGDREVSNPNGTRGVALKGGGKVRGGCLNKESDYRNSKNRLATVTCSKWTLWEVIG